MRTQLDDFEARSIDRFVRHKDKSKPSESVVCVVVSSPLVDIQFASGMCTNCRRAQGRRISSAAGTQKVTDAVLACPHCSILSGESMTALLPAVLADVGHVFVYKHVKAATLHRLAETWSALRRLSADRIVGGVDSASTPASTSTTTRPSDHFVGLTPESFFAEMARHLAAGKRGAFLPEHQMPAMALSANETVLTPLPARAASFHAVRSTS